MGVPTTCRAWVLIQQPGNSVALEELQSVFELQEVPLPALGATSILVKTITLSNDPAQRVWIRKGGEKKNLYVKPLIEGDIMRCFGVAQVIATGSNATRFTAGDVVYGLLRWAEYMIADEEDFWFALDDKYSHGVYAGILGTSGFAAYTGLVRVLEFQPGQSLIVSSAAGSVGNVVVQYAKNVMQASKIIAIAGSPEKCDWLRSVGADVALNYKSPTFETELAEATPGGVDAFFDNVGGAILDAVLPRMKKYGRIAACGAVSTYNSTGTQILHNYFEIVTQRIRLEGFICTDWLDMWPKFQVDILKAVEDGLVTLGEGTETVVDLRGKFEDIPVVWYRLFEGTTRGKLLSIVGDVE